MDIEALKSIESAIVNDATIKSLVPVTGESRLAFYSGTAPTEDYVPYIVAKFDSAPSNLLKDTVSYELDVLDVSPSPAIVMQIGQRLEKLLTVEKYRKLHPMIKVIERGAQGMIPDEDPNRQHYHLTLEISFYRKDLFV